MTAQDRRVGGSRRREPVACTADDRLAQVIHDARQQAASLSALVQVLDRGPQAVTHEGLHYLARAASQLSELLDHLLDRSMQHERLVVWATVEDLVMARQLSQTVHLLLDVDERATVVASPELLRRAVGNLLENAARAAGSCGTVRLEVSRALDATVLMVEDSGPGFGTAPGGRASLGLGVVAELVGSVQGSFEIRRSDLGGALLRITVPDRLPDPAMEGVGTP